MQPASVGRAGSSTLACARTLFTSPPPSSRTVSIWCGTWLNRMPPPFDGVELLRPARTIEIVGVVEAVDHAELAQLAARDHAAHRAHRRIERMGVADDELHLVALHRRDDGVAVGERQRHRLFQDDVLAVLGRHDGVRRVELVRRRDVDHLDRRVGAQLLHVGVGAGVEVAGEGLARAPDAGRRRRAAHSPGGRRRPAPSRRRPCRGRRCQARSALICQGLGSLQDRTTAGNFSPPAPYPSIPGKP